MRRYHLERQYALSVKLMLYSQWKKFITDLKQGTPVQQAIEGLQISEEQKQNVTRIFEQAAGYGVNQAQAASQDAVASVTVPNAPMPALSVDWSLINEDARTWARGYAYSQINGITDTTRRILSQRVNDWMVSGKPLQELMRDKRLVQLFGPTRAKMIAVTEVTRAYAEANQLVFQQTGVQQRRWNTANDELVCPICGPLNGMVVGITEPFSGGIMLPPAHPNCRCWITPVVSEELDGTEHSG